MNLKHYENSGKNKLNADDDFEFYKFERDGDEIIVEAQ